MRLLQLKHALEKATGHAGVRPISTLFVGGNRWVGEVVPKAHWQETRDQGRL
jgi:hypothetical protein